LVIQNGKLGGNSGMVAVGLNVNANQGTGANQVGSGGGAVQGNFWNASPSANAPGNIFGTGSGNAVQQQIDPVQVIKDLIGGQ